jgi:hypothetical protein
VTLADFVYPVVDTLVFLPTKTFTLFKKKKKPVILIDSLLVFSVHMFPYLALLITTSFPNTWKKFVLSEVVFVCIFTRQYGVVMNILVLDLLNFLYNNLQYIVNFLSFPGCYISSKTFITNFL